MSNQTIVQEVKHLLSTGQRASISTKTFEKIIELLEQKEKALNEISDIARSLYYQSISDPVKREDAIYSIINIVTKAKEVENEKRD